MTTASDRAWRAETLAHMEAFQVLSEKAMEAHSKARREHDPNCAQYWRKYADTLDMLARKARDHAHRN